MKKDRFYYAGQGRIHELLLADLELQLIGKTFPRFELRGLYWDALIEEEYKPNLLKYSTYFKDTFKWELRQESRGLMMSDNYGPHLIYPFKGKMIPDTASVLLGINIFHLIPAFRDKVTVLDPFCGSGTILVEAMLKGNENISKIIGNEIVPFYADISKAKIKALLGEEIVSLSPDTLKEYTPNWKDPKPEDIIYALYRYSKNNKNWPKNASKRMTLVKELMDVMFHTIDKWNIEICTNVEVKVGSATNLDIPDESVDVIVTSPPYSLALNYQRENPIPPDYPKKWDPTLQVESGDLDKYRLLMLMAYCEMNRVLTDDGFVAIVIGDQNVKGQRIPNVEWTKDKMQSLGFELYYEIEELVFGARNISKDTILIFEKVSEVPSETIEFIREWKNSLLGD